LVKISNKESLKMVKRSPLESAKYRLDLKSHNGQVFGVSLHSKKRNQNIKEVLVHDSKILCASGVTSSQVKFLSNMEDMANTRPYKVPSDIEKIRNFKRRVNRQGEWESY
jgi:hypothetical protein